MCPGSESVGPSNDFQLIRWGNRRFDPCDAMDRHAGDVAFIETELAAPNDAGEAAVVVTHDLPSPACIARPTRMIPSSRRSCRIGTA